MDNLTNIFIATHPGSIVSVAIIEDLSYSEEPTYLDSLFRLLTPKMVDGRDGTQLKEKIADLMSESIGQPLKDFRELNINGDTVRPADLKGKYVFDLRPLDGSKALEFGMRDIADDLLVDPNGIIIGRYLSMRALKHKLETLPY